MSIATAGSAGLTPNAHFRMDDSQVAAKLAKFYSD